MMSRIRNEMDGVTSEGRSELEGDSTEATSGDSILVSDIVRGTCCYLLYGQVLGDYVEYVVSVWTIVR